MLQSIIIIMVNYIIMDWSSTSFHKKNVFCKRQHEVYQESVSAALMKKNLVFKGGKLAAENMYSSYQQK